MRRGRGRPKKYWEEVIRQNMTNFTEKMTVDKKEWKSCIRIEGNRGRVLSCLCYITSDIVCCISIITLFAAVLFLSCRNYTAFRFYCYAFFHCFLLLLLELDVLEPMGFRKQTL